MFGCGGVQCAFELGLESDAMMLTHKINWTVFYYLFRRHLPRILVCFGPQKPTSRCKLLVVLVVILHCV